MVVCVPPGVARVRVKREVELLEMGLLVVREGWNTRQAIYPAVVSYFIENYRSQAVWRCYALRRPPSLRRTKELNLSGPKLQREEISVGCFKEELLKQTLRVSRQPLKAHQVTSSLDSIVNANSRSCVNTSSTTTSSEQSFVTVNSVRQGVLRGKSLYDRQDAYSTLQGLFQRATTTKLRGLYRLFATTRQGAEWSTAFRVLTQELRIRFFRSRTDTSTHAIEFRTLI
uniref:Uncharacterized protein n=1 Tax=Physcomitrium patens TaxID=3218 RepID=A0A2K1IAN5_PHYPA|nr:hypothetical protein PHYPA_030903 [Physcomitrium patens]